MTHTDHVIDSDCDDVHCTVNTNDDRHKLTTLYTVTVMMYTVQST